MQAKVIFQIGVTSSNLFSRILSKILQKTYFLNSIQNDGTILDENHSEKYPVIFPQTFRKISTKICWWNWERFMQEIKITVGMFQDIFTKWLKKISKFSLKKSSDYFLVMVMNFCGFPTRIHLVIPPENPLGFLMIFLDIYPGQNIQNSPYFFRIASDISLFLGDQ